MCSAESARKPPPSKQKLADPKLSKPTTFNFKTFSSVAPSPTPKRLHPVASDGRVYLHDCLRTEFLSGYGLGLGIGGMSLGLRAKELGIRVGLDVQGPGLRE